MWAPVATWTDHDMAEELDAAIAYHAGLLPSVVDAVRYPGNLSGLTSRSTSSGNLDMARFTSWSVDDECAEAVCHSAH